MQVSLFLHSWSYFASTSVVAEGEAAGAKLHEYFAAFNEKDVDRIVRSIYSTPVQIGGGSGTSYLCGSARTLSTILIDCMSKSKRRAGLNPASKISRYAFVRYSGIGRYALFQN